jgi:hypothetical protein
VQAGGEFRVWAEVNNRMNVAQSQYVLLPGTNADMYIELRAGAAKQAVNNRDSDPRLLPVRR